MPQALPDSSVQLLPIGLSAAQVRDYYHGFANATLWPLLHNAIEKPRFERAWWHAYRDVNAIFADRALAALDEYPDAIAWVHDYQLMLVPQLIRSRGRSSRSGSSCTCRGRRRTSSPGCPGASRS